MARLYGMDQLAAADVCVRIASLDRWLMLDAEVIDLEAAHIRLASLFVRRLELGLRIPDAIHVAEPEWVRHSQHWTSAWAAVASALDVAVAIIDIILNIMFVMGAIIVRKFLM